jgi:NAD(P)H-dependent FMN reductase
MTNNLNLAVIVASTRKGRFGHNVAAWFTAQAEQRGDLNVDVIDLAETNLPDTLTGFGETPPEEVRALAPRLAKADAFVIVTPEYNHSFPAPLKTAIDWYLEEWAAKPVGFVSYGGVSGGLRAVEQLRPIFAEVHAMTVREQVSFAAYWEKFGEDALPLAAEACNGAAKSLLDQLTWWATALRTARTETPYSV